MTAVRKPPPTPFWTRTRLKGLLMQALFLVGLVWLGHFLFSNAMANLSRQGVAAGFGFLDARAGFDVALSFLPFDASSSYRRALRVAVVNTLVLSVLGIALASVIGFLLGLARVSRNWLIARLAAVHIETFRNIPLLLQQFFWYFEVLRPLPTPRASVEIGGGFFLNNRGLFMPKPMLDDGAAVALIALIAGLALAGLMQARARRRRMGTGRGVAT